MSKGITLTWEYDARDRMVLVVRKSRGKLTISEIEDALRYEKQGVFRGAYAIMLNCMESTIGGSGWGDEYEPKGDVVFLYQLEEGCDCPVCGSLLPPFDCCPSCGEPWKKDAQ